MNKSSRGYYWGSQSSLVRKGILRAEDLAKEVLKSPERFEEICEGLVATVMSRITDNKLRKRFAVAICNWAINEVKKKKGEISKRRIQVLRKMFAECALYFGSSPKDFEELISKEVPKIRGPKRKRSFNIGLFGSVALSEVWGTSVRNK